MKESVDMYGNGKVEMTFERNGTIEGIDYDALVAVLVQNIQTLNTEIEVLKTRGLALEQAFCTEHPTNEACT